MLVVADRADPDDARQLADLLARVPDAPSALVLPAAGLSGFSRGVQACRLGVLVRTGRFAA
ncbi:hypothetical protein [Streptacidiphilus carbonis]|jgi:hypothetical protein|uniref:hypothetical protein n=1 Tax=Streptacidiphilus carbonis TaxID=105422 RepID=UPI000A650FE4|nr:hypothetical protein [Streptacidiphilus carbonis]